MTSVGGKKRCKKCRDNTVNLSYMYAWTHTSKTRRSGRDGRKPISLQQIAFSAASRTLSFGLYACLTMCISSMCVCETVRHCACTVPLFCLAMCYQLASTCSYACVWLYLFVCVCVCVCVCTKHCKHPFLPIPLNITVMPRDDKPFSGASWQRGGVLIP